MITLRGTGAFSLTAFDEKCKIESSLFPLPLPLNISFALYFLLMLMCMSTKITFRFVLDY